MRIAIVLTVFYLFLGLLVASIMQPESPESWAYVITLWPVILVLTTWPWSALVIVGAGVMAYRRA